MINFIHKYSIVIVVANI